jgi:hypothetical protein
MIFNTTIARRKNVLQLEIKSDDGSWWDKNIPITRWDRIMISGGNITTNDTSRT